MEDSTPNRAHFRPFPTPNFAPYWLHFAPYWGCPGHTLGPFFAAPMMSTQLNMPNSYSLNIDYLSDEIGCDNSQLWTWKKWSYVELGLCWDGCIPSMWMVGLQSFYVNGCYLSIETFHLLRYGCWILLELEIKFQIILHLFHYHMYILTLQSFCTHKNNINLIRNNFLMKLKAVNI